MPSIRRLGRVSAGLAPVVLTLVLAGCADDRPASRNTPLQPGTQGSGEPDFVLLWNAGPETARLSDELAAFVVRAFYHANGGTNAAPPTDGVLQEGPAGNFTWQPGAPGDDFEVRMLGGRVITLTIHAANGGWQVPEIGGSGFYVPREFHSAGLEFDVQVAESGAFNLRLTQEWLSPGDSRLDDAEALDDFFDGRDGFERSLTGGWPYLGRNWSLTAIHQGIDLYGPHLAASGESMLAILESSGEQLSVSCRLVHRGFEGFHVPGGSGGHDWLLEQGATHLTGGVYWSILDGVLQGSLTHNVWYAPLLVPDYGGWDIGGELRRDDEKLGRFAFDRLVQPGTPGEPVVVMQGGVRMPVMPAGRPAPVSLFDDPFIED